MVLKREDKETEVGWGIGGYPKSSTARLTNCASFPYTLELIASSICSHNSD